MEEQRKSYQSPKVLVYSLMLEDRIMSDNGEMHNGGFLDE